jgi:glucose-1-phosphate cytidylyltransferase
MKKSLKAVILCGGQGTRIRDISEVVPKPMLSIGDKPILWHIMKIYAHYGITDFILCLGYKGWAIKEFFLNYKAQMSDVTLTLGKGPEQVRYHQALSDEAQWQITLAQTGENAQTGARIWNIRRYLKDSDAFLVTYGDGVADVNLTALIHAHKKSHALGTVTGVHPSGRFGEMEVSAQDKVLEFNEKPNVSAGMINGGFMIFQTEALDTYFRPGEDLILETEVLTRMAQEKRLGVYRHPGFWQCVDTPREYHQLNELWKSGKASWKVWK